MRFVHKNENGYGGVKVVAELNQYIEPEKREGRGGVAGEGQGLSEEDELRIIDDGEDSNCRRSACPVQLPAVTHRSQSQIQGRVRWDRFLPVGNPKVLLVESDDSTRHVVTALLRNCSYEVTAVSSGIEAWRILEDLNNQIDLVLTEVVTSGLSGIGLLSKIMSHTSCHNTPVIMMSSLDSMGLVVRCLSKGAADFLMKPIRKNELKNLWQHIWRRCHYSSGSGGESFMRNEKSIGAKCAEESNDETGSDDEDDNRSIGLQTRNGSDNGSGTQSSWTKKAAEVDSPKRPSAWDQATDPPDSTCAQVIYPMPETFASSWMPGAMQEHEGQDNQLDNVPMGKDLEIGVPRNTDSPLSGPNRKLTQSTTTTEKFQTSQLDLNLKNDDHSFDEENLEVNNDKPKDERIKQAMNLPGEAISNEEHLRGIFVSDEPPILSENSKNKDKVMNYHEDLPSLELSLKRVDHVTDASTNGLDQDILRHSQLSAFTRYNTGSTGNQGQTGNVGGCSPPNNSSEAAKQSNSDLPNQISNGSSNNNMGSTTNRSFTKPVMATDYTPAKSTVNGSQQSSVFQPVQSGKTTGGPLNTALLQENEMGDQQLKIQHHLHYRQRNFRSVQKLQEVPPQDDMSKSTLQCGSSSNASKVPTEANVANCSLNGSASGSNHGSNGSSAVLNAEGSIKVHDNGIAAKDGVDNGSGSGSGSGVGVNQNRSAQREAALNKFLKKRKERCFDKKVRYQSRKKLADQRPRVRGQFVRQERETKGKFAES